MAGFARTRTPRPLTGSDRAGAAVGAAAGRAVKKSVLELGESDAFVVLADVEAAAAAAVKARFTNAGQSCVCAKRFIVEAPIAEQFTAAFVAATRALIVGDPTDPRTNIGPVARADLRDGIQRQVEDSLAAGATLLTGGRPLPGTGYFFDRMAGGRVGSAGGAAAWAWLVDPVSALGAPHRIDSARRWGPGRGEPGGGSVVAGEEPVEVVRRQLVVRRVTTTRRCGHRWMAGVCAVWGHRICEGWSPARGRTPRGVG
ncbi:hypothetical protein DLE60_25045 [Micromonospora globispora]|uniref:Aldehyde dehydrogenase domain-containing protein n=1 Tax=Micromonospora globispora TaxID=1450148 RepID=A0A317K2U4_9ACTN|nr:aldehyde dehydrogenase family protein [Micromonospora globispora]PWU47357.1 hypothetical protein DLJ46_15050 [Micromonospora globispora]PWU57179.1 hypothetical protein DLE60_25045 [Micromonospora globispora]RQX06199.1 hypothetical protein DKL51_01680 [Micromonospora globispora]